MGRKKPVNVDENPQGGGGGGVKSKKKNRGVVDDDEYSIGTEVSEDQSQNSEQLDAAPAGKKKGKKGGGAKRKDDDGDEEEENDDVDAPVVFTGKKKSNKSKKSNTTSLFSASNFDVLDENDKGGVVDDDEPVAVVDNSNNNKKKSSKSKKSNGVFSASTFDAIGDDEEEEGKEDHDHGEDGDDVPVIQFTGKKKSSKSNKNSGSGSLFAASAFDGLDEEDENKEEGENNEEGEDDEPVITFTGKKKSKSSKKSNSLFASALIDEAEEEGNDGEAVSVSNDGELEDDDVPAITFSGKKKSSKSKKNKAGLDMVEEASDVQKHSNELVGNNDKDVTVNNQGSEEVAQISKNKKKKKKSGRTAQEEDDLDKILAELGEAAPAAKTTSAPPQEDNAQLQTEPIDAAEVIDEKKEVESETMESAAAKKKKKKKEKEKEKKAAASSTSTAAPVNEKEEKVETKSKGAAKKLPKHVIEMQEALARRRELEEKLKKEEEEKLRKEEEERRKKEEEERLAEEAKRRKKEKEKEKLLKKKQEGKLLTAKQKDEARRREAMRNQFLANSSGVLPTTETTTATTKRPKYQTKKSKQTLVQANGVAPEKPEDTLDTKQNQQDVVAEVDTVEVDKDEELEAAEKDAEQKPDVVDGIEGNKTEEEDAEDWDAKSWEEAVLNLVVKSPFEEEEEKEEEVETVPVPVAKKEKHVTKPAESIDAPPIEGKPSLASREVPNAEPVKRENAESKEVQQESHPTYKNKRKDVGSSRDARSAEAHAKRSADDLRSPICCIMGHVDTGKTKLLDCIRRTNVQEGEAGGITQQIGATYFPAENIRERTRELKADATLRVPGLLVIDTPGHESFTNLRSRGSGLCDIAILVVDIMHGLEPQTIESLNLLKMRNTEFIVALNKVDRLYGWKTIPNAPIVKAMKQQTNDVQNEFKMRLIQIVTQFKEQGLNTELYYKNKEMGETFSIVPTSAISGEGIPDLLLLLVQWTQKTMTEKLMFSDEVQCTVLEVKVIEGLGTTIDVVLVNGVLHEGDQIVVCGMQGAIVTTIRALLTPHPMKELRVKGTYLHHKEIKAAQGIKITAQGLENAVPGTALYVVGPDDDLQEVMDTAEQDMNSVLSRIDKSGEGVCVQASTLGSLEALLEFFKSPAVKIPVSGISIGPVHKKDVMKASVMLEKKKEYATILAFDVKVTPEARELAEESGVKIFIADIIYHLFDQFKAYIDNLKEEKKKEAAEEAVFPCVLKIMPNCVFNKKDPIVLGVDVLEGLCKVGTPICIPSREYIDIGRIASIEVNHKQVDIAKKGQKVAIKIASTNAEEQQKMYGRHFEIEDELVSHITRTSIDVLKANYREDLSIEDWKLVVKLKNLFQIQ